MRRDDEFDFTHVEFVRLAGSVNADVEESVGNATVKFKGEVRTRYIESGIIYA